MPRLFVALWPPDDVVRELVAMPRPGGEVAGVGVLSGCRGIGRYPAPVTRGVHPKKEVRKAITRLQRAGWTIMLSSGRSAHTHDLERVMRYVGATMTASP